MTSMALMIDEAFVSRLLLGALSEHEQRMLTAQLARSDPDFRASLRSILEPFEMLDDDLLREYSMNLGQDPEENERMRRKILTRSFTRDEDLGTMLHGFTVSDALALGGVTRKLFSWTMAELMLERSRKSTKTHQARTCLYLASMVIDMVEILGATGHSPYYANVITDVRRRIRQADEKQAPPPEERPPADQS